MCDKCNGSGFMPFVKDGKEIPHMRVHCDCVMPMRSVYSEIKASDFNFPCSDTFRAYYEVEYRGYDPAYIPPQPETVITEEHHFYHHNIKLSKSQWAKHYELEKKIQLLSAKLNQLSALLPAQAKKPKTGGASEGEWEDVTDKYYRVE